MHLGALRRRALHLCHQALKALALVKTLFLADADHGPRIRPIGAAAQRDLVHDGCAIDQPANHTHVRPQQGRVVEDGAVFGAARVQGIEHLITRGPQRLARAVQVQAVAAFILHLGDQDGLALEAGRAADPVSLGLHADDLRVRVLANLAHQCLAIGFGHPVLGLDLAVSVHGGVKAGLGCCISAT